MKENKDIEVSNGAFDLKIHWNSGVMSTQAAVFLGMGALFLFSNSSTVRGFAVLGIVFDLIAVVFYLLSSGKKEAAEEQVEETTESHDPVAVEHKSGSKKSVKTVDKTIKKKVPVPNPNAARKHGESVPQAATVESPEPVPLDIPQGHAPSAIPQEPVPVPVPTPTGGDTNMEEVDEWAGFF